MARKKKTRPDPAELEAQADSILSQDNDGMQRQLEMAEVIKRNTELMEQIQRDLIAPNNDPVYRERLEACRQLRDDIANVIETVHLVPDGRKHWLGLGLTNPTNRAQAEEAVRRLGEHFEAKIIRHEGVAE